MYENVEHFETLTVLELRKAAKEMGVPLGAGISKQGIVDKLNAARAAKSPADQPIKKEEPPKAPVQTSMLRTASIIADDDDWGDEDALPVSPAQPRTLPPSYSPSPVSTPAPRPQSPENPLPSKGPVFTTEGSRAWHNPKAYQPNSYQPGQQRHEPYRTPAAQQDSGAYRPMMPDNRRDYSYPQQIPFQVPASAAPQPQQDPLRGGLSDLLSNGDCQDTSGYFVPSEDGSGVLYTAGLVAGQGDVYVSPSQVRRFKLRRGDYVEGKKRPLRDGEKDYSLLFISKINDSAAEDSENRPSFDNLTAIYPKKRVTLSSRLAPDLALRQIDLLAPLGFGQRLLIVNQQKNDSFLLCKAVIDSISANYPAASLMLLSIDEKPEEATLMKERLKAKVQCANIDLSAQDQVTVAEMCFEHAKRLVEQKQDVVIVVDNMIRLANAYNLSLPDGARQLPCGLPAAVVNRIKRLFGCARTIREGGSLTVLGIAGRTDDPVGDTIIKELRGAANAEWRIVTEGKQARIDFAHSRTLHGNLLLTQEEQQAADKVRKMLACQENSGQLDELFLTCASAEEISSKLS